MPRRHHHLRGAAPAAVVLLLTTIGAAQTDPCLVERHALDSMGSAKFGTGVAIDRRAMFVGASSDDELGLNAGALYVFERGTTNTWVETAKILPPEPARFGWAVAMCGDDVLVGAPYDNDFGVQTGAVYRYRRTLTGALEFVSKITAPAPADYDRFGYAIACTDDLVVIGMPEDIPGSDSGIGAAWILERGPDDDFAFVEQIRPSDGGLDDLFGVALATDGTTVVVGAPFHDVQSTNAGAAYAFERIDGMWTETAKLQPEVFNDYNIGFSVAVLGEEIIVSAPRAFFEGAVPGVVYVYRKIDGAWTEHATLAASDGTSAERFGDVVALSPTTLAISAPWDDDVGFNSGAVYLFDRDGAGDWIERTALRPVEAATNDGFGDRLALDGGLLAIGAPNDEHLEADNAGAVYVVAGIGDCAGTGALDCTAIEDGAPDVDRDGIPDACDCVGDVDGDGQIGFVDLVTLLASWGPTLGDEPADVNADGTVGMLDLMLLLSGFGACGG